MKTLAVVIVCIVAASAVKPRFNSKFQRLAAPVPHTLYGPPPQEYGPPPQETTTVAQEESTTTDMPTTTEAESELVNSTKRSTGRLTKGSERGVYYIYHPTGQLQKVIYSTNKDARKGAYTAQVKYEDVEPIRAPIFTYDPKTLILSKLQP